MDWITGIQNAINYVEEHITEELDYEQIAHIFEKGDSKPKERALVKLRQLMEQEEITDEELRRVVAAKSRYEEGTPLEEYPDSFITGWVMKYWTQITDVIKASRNAE